MHSSFRFCFFRIFILFLAAGFFLSCSDSVLRITSINQTYIIDFFDQTAAPDISLSLFVQTDSEVRKVDQLRVTHVSSNFFWDVKDITLLQGKNNNNWAGYSNFKAVQGSDFPQGRYNLCLTDKAGNQCETSFIINVPEELKSPDLKSAEEYLKKENVQFTKSIALYDENEILLYLGEESEDLDSTEEYIQNYPSATSVRNVYQLNGATIAIKFPPQKFNQDDLTAGEKENSSGE